MAKIIVNDDELVVTLEGLRIIGTFKTELSIPLAHVRGVTADADTSIDWAGFTKDWAGLKDTGEGETPGRKVWGTNAYGHYIGGTFVQDGDKVFWDVKDPKKTIVVTLSDENYKRLYLEVEDPAAAVDLIEEALQ